MSASREFFDRARAAADDEGRLAPGPMTEWDVFPFEAVTVAPLTEFDTEPSTDTAPEDCKVCRVVADEPNVLWSDERFCVSRRPATSLMFWATIAPRTHLTLDQLDVDALAEMGQLLGRAFTAVSALDGVGRVHLTKWENTTGHLLWNVMARPEGVLQMRGSNLPIWADLLPPVPEPDLSRRADEVARALVAFDE